jgi:hypothetical protein
MTGEVARFEGRNFLAAPRYSSREKVTANSAPSRQKVEIHAPSFYFPQRLQGFLD